MKCQICKKQIEKAEFKPEVNKKVITICSKECFNKYIECWKDEKNFPNNLNEINTQKVNYRQNTDLNESGLNQNVPMLHQDFKDSPSENFIEELDDYDY